MNYFPDLPFVMFLFFVNWGLFNQRIYETVRWRRRSRTSVVLQSDDAKHQCFSVLKMQNTSQIRKLLFFFVEKGIASSSQILVKLELRAKNYFSDHDS